MKRITTVFIAVLMVVLVLAGCGGQAEPASSVAPDSIASESVPGSVSAESSSGEKAPSTDELVPIYGNQIADGTYSIEVKSSSSMFKIVDCQLTVANGEMSAVVTLSGTGYEKLYMGTGEEAGADSDDKYIYFVEDAEGAYTYEVPVEALDMDIDCTAFSIRKQTWYDRVIVFQSELIPADAITG